MSSSWNGFGLCRCCHSKGNFKTLTAPHTYEGKTEMYSEILLNTFELNVTKNSDSLDAYCICRRCETRLLDAAQFKRQVQECELNFYRILDYKDLQNFDELIKKENESTECEVFKSECLANEKTHNDHSDSKFEDDEKQFDAAQDHSSDFEDTPLSVLQSIKTNRQTDPADSEDKEPAKIEDLKRNCGKVKPKKYSCEICEKRFTYKGSLEVHTRLHRGEGTLACHLCGTKLPGHKQLTRHIADTHAVDGGFPCNACPEVFDKPRLLKQHLHAHYERDFSCDVCSKVFRRKKGLKEHLKTHTGEKKFTCDICSKSFGHNQTLKSHVYTHTGERPHVCDVCGRGFPQRTHLRRHIRVLHHQLRPHACAVCHKHFSSKSYLRVHERQHSGARPYSCDLCQRSFAAYTTLKVHMRVHTGLKPYSCDFCGRQFAQMTSFKLHQRTHTGEKPYTCNVCKKPFADNGYLKIHLRIHTEEKPYSCEICKHCFRETGQLKRHLRIHSGVKAYTCRICNKQIGNLSKHMRVHSDVKPFSCTVCNKEFSVNGNLKLHMRTHTGLRPYSCELCHSHFTQSSGLKRHRCVHKSDV